MEKRSFLFTALFFVLILIPLASSEVILSQPSNLYNLGDRLNVTIKVKGPADGILKTRLDCGEGEIFYADYLSLGEGGERVAKEGIKLVDKGDCFVSAKIGQEKAKTSFFRVSDKIGVGVELSKEHVLPQGLVEVSGTAIKENGERVEGKGKIYLGDKFLKGIAVERGMFNESFNLPNNLTKYSYELVFKVNDSQNLNYGETIESINILKRPSKIKLNLSKARPGEEFSLSANLLDHNGKVMKKDVTIKISSPLGLFYQGTINSGRPIEINIPSNASIGDWQVKAVYRDLEEKKHFYVGENEEISTNLSEGILLIENVGNVPFRRVVGVSISGEGEDYNKSIFVDLGVGEEKKVRLTAPAGVYDVKVGKDFFNNVRLTGGTVGVQEISEGIFNLPFFFVLGIILLFLIIIFISHGGIKKEVKKVKQAFGREVKQKNIAVKKWGESEKEKKKIKEIFERYVDKDVARRIIEEPDVKGEKKEVTALFVDIRGFTKLSEKHGEEVIPLLNKYFKIVSDAVERYGGIVNHIEADEVFALFNAVKDKPNHIVDCVKAAKKIVRDLRDINEKVKIGIGINTGEATVGNIGSDKIMKFTSIGDTINLAERLEEKAKGNILVSREVADKVKGEIEVKKAGIKKIGDRHFEVFEVPIKSF